MEKASLLIFNPDTDYALASGSDFYTPPASIIRLIEERPEQALAWGRDGDFLFSDISGWGNAEWERIGQIKPWGWNFALRRKLLDAGCPGHLLPSRNEIEAWRDMSHRRTTISFNRMMGMEILPCEIRSEDASVSFWRENPGCWFKAPWSSSGRGVICTEELEEHHIRPWVRGIIRRQGSVIGESGVDRVVDFASEWEIRDSKARYLGLSLFRSSGRGKYLGQSPLTQKEIYGLIAGHSDEPLGDVLEKQRETLDRLISTRYRGPLGIDMLIDRNGKIYPCVEINLRRTMGHVALGYNRM